MIITVTNSNSCSDRDSSSGSQSFVLVESSPSPRSSAHRMALGRQDLMLLFDGNLSFSSNSAVRRTAFQSNVESFLDSYHRRLHIPLPPLRGSDGSTPTGTVEAKPKFYYKFLCCSTKLLKIRFDRLALVALLDRFARC